MTKTCVTSTIALLLIGQLLPSTEGQLSNLLSFFLLGRTLSQQGGQRGGNTGPTEWAEWGMWSTCTSSSSSEAGVRVRSRGCDVEPCTRLKGDNYQVETCNRKERPDDNSGQKSKYLKMCEDDPVLNRTISCKIYKERPLVAYNIVSTVGCLLPFIGDTESSREQSNQDPFDERTIDDPRENMVFGRPPDTRAGEVGPAFVGDFETSPLSSGRFSEDGVEPEQQSTQNQLTDLLSFRATQGQCESTCNAFVLAGTRIGEIPNAPAVSTVTQVLALLQNLPFLSGRRNLILAEFNSCISQCRLLGPNYSLVFSALADRGLLGTNPNLAITLGNFDEENRRRRREVKEGPDITDRMLHIGGNEEKLLMLDLLHAKRGGKVPNVRKTSQYAKEIDSAGNDAELDKVGAHVFKDAGESGDGSAFRDRASGKLPKSSDDDDVKSTQKNNSENIVVTLLRHKRQAVRSPDRYESPCFVSEVLSSDPRVLNIDDTEGELFFYEDMRQKFMRRICRGRPLFRRSLFLPREQVTQERTQQTALCKQAYTRRYGLLVVSDPEGEFSFSDGQKFTLKFRPFKLESHCELAVIRS
ncbi:unnamed protein product [Clavelina lepadiformis]|uniref:Uncharacterized protein n=2 Tax=Clavelina lepadiformis TaxID=159417 RepID=A0ABP0GN64_CLALP